MVECVCDENNRNETQQLVLASVSLSITKSETIGL